jgi:hypothetical protein
MTQPPDATRRRKQYILLGAMGAALLLLGAYWLLRPAHPVGERTFWYDLSEKKLFVARPDLTPPQDGLGGEPGDAFPATVIAWEGSSEQTVAFLTSFTPELRDLHQQAQELKAQGLPPPDKIGDRLWVTRNTLVRTVDSDQWHPKDSPAGLKIVGVLARRGQNGGFPRICSPDD